ncbi:MAG: hypothetical protein Q9221_007982 [Calogaya cf. arnoldii]
MRVHGVFAMEKKVDKYAFLFCWCEICGAWQSRMQSDVDDHFRSHAAFINETLHTSGSYVGETSGNRTVRQSYCAFCLHNTELAWLDRINAVPVSDDLERSYYHTYRHVCHLTDDQRYRCPASMPCADIDSHCTVDSVMTKHELIVHLEEEHGLVARQEEGRPNRKKKTLDKTNPETDDVATVTVDTEGLGAPCETTDPMLPPPPPATTTTTTTTEGPRVSETGATTDEAENLPDDITVPKTGKKRRILQPSTPNKAPLAKRDRRVKGSMGDTQRLHAGDENFALDPALYDQ